MLRNCDMSEISDGKFYGIHDMVKVGCLDCEGCSHCCHVMEDTIILDPYDVHCLTLLPGMDWNALLMDKIELGVADGIILPHLKVDPVKGCPLLNQEGRCSVHSNRPGLCRIFPLGRFYREETKDFSYFLQTHECIRENRTKVKVSKWIGIPNLEQNQQFIARWHFFLRAIQKAVDAESDDTRETVAKQVSLYIIKTFYARSYDETDFYIQFEQRLQSAERVLSI